MEVRVIKCNSFVDFLEKLSLQMGIDKELTEAVNKTKTPVVDLSFFIAKIAEKKGWKYERANGWLANIAEISPIAAFSIIVREIAVWLDAKYVDHIENSEKIYAISPLDGRIHEICKKHIKNYRNFAAFRTIEDAKFACNLMRNHIKDMFKSK